MGDFRDTWVTADVARKAMPSYAIKDAMNTISDGIRQVALSNKNKYYLWWDPKSEHMPTLIEELRARGFTVEISQKDKFLIHISW